MNRMLLLLLLGALFAACSNSESVYSQQKSGSILEVDSLEGMLAVRMEQKNLMLGSNDNATKTNERPQMNVSLQYDFSIGKHEVTCGEYNSLMKSVGALLDCEGDNVPATNVTYYDAVLFANARSKAEGFDSVYTYTAASFDAEKHCSNLEGFAYHPEKLGYRLPTEAEWVYVAGLNWEQASGWTADNSDYKLHDVCAFATTDNEACDLLGNAMEWVNDWLGNFRDTMVVNYVGAPDGGSLGQRVVKGGSFRNETRSVALYSRGDVYMVTSSTRANYVGFRLAFGAIPDALWMGSDGKAAENRVVPLAGTSTVRSVVGTNRSKLVFRNDLTKNLAYIDYAGGSLSVIEIADTLDAYHPEISPDGQKVAFCTGLEGVAGKSSLYIRDLNAEGSNLVKLDVKSAAIPRWRVLENGDTAIVYVSDAGNNKNESDFKATSTWQVTFANGKFGKPQKLFDGAYHGGLSEDGSLAVTGARLLRARVGKSDSSAIWYNEEQACNASLASDSSKRTLFLDFGSKTGTSFVGEKYGTHERILVVDSVGTLIQAVAAPAGYAFDHSEWVKHSGKLAVVTFTNASGAHTKIALVNLEDNSFVELAEGDELWHPCFWFKESFVPEDDVLLNLDSAGVYYIEGQSWDHQVMSIKMSLFWKNINSIEVLGVGSSRIEDGLIPLNVSAGKTLNMGHPGNDLNAALYVAENYGLLHLPKLKAVVVSLDIDLWQVTTEYTHEMFDVTPGFVYDANHQFWKDEIPYAFVDAVNNAMVGGDAFATYYTSMGFAANPSGSWGNPDVERDSTWQSVLPTAIEWNLERLKSFVEKAKERNVVVVGVIFPQNPGYRNTGAWGRYGPTRTVAKKTLNSLEQLEASHSNFMLLNENNMGNHDYSDEMAVNTDHLSELGARQLTERLDSLLKKME